MLLNFSFIKTIYRTRKGEKGSLILFSETLDNVYFSRNLFEYTQLKERQPEKFKSNVLF